VQSLTLQLSGVVAALVLGGLAENYSFVAAFAVVAGVLALGACTCVGLREQAGSAPVDSTFTAPTARSM